MNLKSRTRKVLIGGLLGVGVVQLIRLYFGAELFRVGVDFAVVFTLFSCIYLLLWAFSRKWL